MYAGITAPASDASKIKSEFQRKIEARRAASHGKDTIKYIHCYVFVIALKFSCMNVY